MRIKSNSLSFLAAITLLIVTGGTAQAAPPLATPNIPAGLPGVDSNLCQVINVGTKPIDIVIDLVNSDTGTVDSTSTVTIDPGKGTNLSGPNPLLNLYCRVRGASAKSVRVTFMALDGGLPAMTVTAP